MKKQIISRILSIFSTIILVAVFVITMHLTISYSRMTHSEGTGIIYAVIWILNSYNIIIALVLNTIAYILLPKINKSDQKIRRNIMPLIIIFLSILVFVVELIIL